MLWISRLQSGQSGVRCVSGDILCRYEYNSGDLFVRSCAKVLRMWCGSDFSSACISGGGLWSTLFGVSFSVCC